jgi:signal transduction histidine kinase/DNA-binding response OmpR family regulator/CHASE3 domain sensor protein
VRRIWLPLKIGFLMILAVSILAAAGYLSYRNISSIVSSIHLEVKPDQRLLSIREIMNDLEKAERSIRIYSVTNEVRDIQPYYNIISNIDTKISSFRNECGNDTVLLQQTDTISRLIGESIYNWNELLYLIHNDRVVNYLKQLSDQLTTSEADNKKTDRKILAGVFNRNKTNQSNINQKEIITNLQEIERQDSIEKNKLKTRESRLTSIDIEIKEQFYRLIARMENEVTELVNDRAVAADALAAETYKWLALFSLSGTLLAVLVMFIVIRYVRKTYAYQKALLQSKTETERLTSAKEQFLANISHEIRTPVTAISGFTDQLLHEPLDENYIRTLKIIKSSSDHLGKMINDILDFSKLQNGKVILEQEHFSIRQLAEEVHALFVPQALKQNNTLSYSVSPDTPEVLLGDPYRLKQIMMNLISNSVKFTSGGKIHFGIKGIMSGVSKLDLVMEFIDTGIGIDENKLDFVFGDFMQEEMSTTRKYGGTGLGLSIVRKLVDLHNGTVEVKSRKNKGTSITCRIPYQTGNKDMIRQEVKLPLVIPEELGKLKILVVDDEEYNRLLLKKIFSRWKIECDEAENGLEAIEQLKKGHYDLLIMDMRMPGLDGLKTTKIIRDEMNISVSEMPVICLSAVSAREDLEEYTKAGINSYLRKPFTEEALLAAILSVIRIKIPDKSGKNVEGEINISAYSGKINLQNLYHLSGGDTAFTRQMLATFLETTKKGLEEMLESARTGQYDKVSGLAHKLLPPCRHLGAIDLTGILKSIEENARLKAGQEVMQKLIGEFSREFTIISELVGTQIAKIK